MPFRQAVWRRHASCVFVAFLRGLATAVLSLAHSRAPLLGSPDCAQKLRRHPRIFRRRRLLQNVLAHPATYAKRLFFPSSGIQLYALLPAKTSSFLRASAYVTLRSSDSTSSAVSPPHSCKKCFVSPMPLQPSRQIGSVHGMPCHHPVSISSSRRPSRVIASKRA